MLLTNFWQVWFSPLDVLIAKIVEDNSLNTYKTIVLIKGSEIVCKIYQTDLSEHTQKSILKNCNWEYWRKLHTKIKSSQQRLIFIAAFHQLRYRYHTHSIFRRMTTSFIQNWHLVMCTFLSLTKSFKNFIWRLLNLSIKICASTLF